MPLIGPVLAVGPAILVALPLGVHTVLWVIGLAGLLQLIESNVLIPRIMHRAVGVSALVGLLAVLAFGTLYGILGVLIAIPMAAVIQVLLDTMVVNAEPVAEPAGLAGSPWEDLRTRVRALRQQARVRLRARTSRMGIDPTADHVVDAVDQEIEVAVARVEKLISVAEKTSGPLAAEAQAAIVEKLQGATQDRAGRRACRYDRVPAEAGLGMRDPRWRRRSPRRVRRRDKGAGRGTDRNDHSDTGARPGGRTEAVVDNLDQATQRFKEAVQDVETLVVAAQQESRGARRGGSRARPHSDRTGDPT